jgi:anaerobic magnesium-protoporphyrin IX monomethyl ester cyclase
MAENKVDLLVIKPGSPKKIYGNLSQTLAAIEQPILGGLVASFVREKGHSVKILDMETEGLDVGQTADKIIEINPLLVNVMVAGANPSASSTPLMVVTGELLRDLKQKKSDIKVILTGIHPSALPEKTLREEKADFIGKGENFYTVFELVEALKAGKDPKELKIAGLWYLKDDKVVDGGWGKMVENLDDLPFAAWDLMEMDKYRSHNWQCFDDLSRRKPYVIMFTSFGCPYNCSYCNIREMYNGKPGIRFRSPENIVEEIDLLVKNYNIKTIKFLDELFAINEERVIKFCDLLIERGYDLNIWAYARINTVTENMLKKMRKAGIKWLCYGIESANKKVRNGVSKIGYEYENILKSVKMTKDADINIIGNFIFGLPDDDMETMQETLDLAKKLECEYINFYAAMAYPGSNLYQESIDNKVELPKTWLGYAQLNEETLPLPTKYLSGREVLAFRDKAFKDYFSDPKYLKMIEEKFGKEAVEHVNEMLKYEIKRKYA